MIEFLNIDILSYYVQNAETAPQHSYTIYWIILLGSMLLSWLVSARMKSRFSEYSQIPIPMTGREVAEQMLKDNHITDVKVTSTPGHLTDHYNPADKTVNLSESVYNSNSIAAAAVAAHEVAMPSSTPRPTTGWGCAPRWYPWCSSPPTWSESC